MCNRKINLTGVSPLDQIALSLQPSRRIRIVLWQKTCYGKLRILKSDKKRPCRQLGARIETGDIPGVWQCGVFRAFCVLGIG